MKKTMKVAIIVSLIAGPALVQAEEETVHKTTATTLSQVVVTATKINQTAEHITDSVTVINEEEIELKNYTDVTEILRLTPSVEFKQAGGPGQFNYPKMRGYGQGHFLVLINGMKINQAYNAGVGSFIGQLDSKLLESVEILRGPQSALYGSDSTAGIMSFTTISGKPGIHLDAGAEYGSLDWKKGYSSFRGGTEEFDYALGLAYTDSGGVHDEEYYTNFSPTFKLAWHPGMFDIELAYLYVDTEFQAAELDESHGFLTSRAEHYAFQTPDPNNANEYEHHLATFNIAQQINDSLRHKLILGWFNKEHYRNDLDDGLLGYQSAPFDNFTFDGVTYNKGEDVPIYDGGDGVAYGNDHKNLMADYNFIWDAQMAGTAANTLLLGVEYLYQKGGKWGKYGDLEANTYNYSLYTNDQLLLLNEALILSMGLRRDEHEVYGGKTTGKIGAAYTFPATETTLFSNYGTSFRSPTFFNLYDARYGNEDITPETG